MAMDPKNPQTPGVYINELSAFPNSVVEVATAIPVFIGYTQQAVYNGISLANLPVKISSQVEFEAMFGKGLGSTLQFVVASASVASTPTAPVINLNGSPYQIQLPQTIYYLYNCIRLFFENGGSSCYIISVGLYSAASIQVNDFQTGLTALLPEQEPTMLLMPDSLSIDQNDYYASLWEIAMKQCSLSRSLICMVDVWGSAGISDPNMVLSGLPGDPVQSFRDSTGTDGLDYTVAYFPWLNTTITQSGDITFANFPDLAGVLEQDAATQASYQKIQANYITPALTAIQSDPYYTNDPNTATVVKRAHSALLALSKNYTQIIAAATLAANVLPPSAAMAGVYAYTDLTRGVWKAPANTSLTAVVSPTMKISDDLQAGFNIDAESGKSINVIRFFPGKGVLAWGARTLDGNSQDWRYLSVRRTMIMIEQSVKIAAASYVFEPNNSTTWLMVNSSISNFLTNLWRQGALAGAKASDAFNVSVGLGSTMTGDDILNGVMNVTVLVAISRPAEFIVITFEQEMQKS